MQTTPLESYRNAVQVQLGTSMHLMANEALIERAWTVGTSAETLAQWVQGRVDPNLTAFNQYWIRTLNDLARTAMGVASRVVQTQGISGLAEADQSAIREKVETYNAFTPDNDPYQEHDFGAFEYNGTTIFWKIDYYDKDLEYGSEDPADPSVTTRVLTIMFSHEY